MDIELFASRKRDHIRLALDPAHQAEGLSALDRVRLVHEALPELDFSEIFLDSPFLGENDLTPFYVAGMTAGHEDAPRINRLLAEACAARGWVMGVGSQRRELGEKSEDRWSEIRASFPKLKLLANIGISQLITASTADLRTLVERLDARALVVHVNALQEALQVEGTPNFRGALPALARVCRELGAPVVLKETGCGFSEATLRRLAETGLAAIDVSGLGGTHWGRIEGARAPESSRQRLAAQTFALWGEPTAESVLAAVRALPRTEIWASGGVRSGLDAAKLIALGAHRVGYAQPALHAALEGARALDEWMERQEFELRVAMFCTGSIATSDLRNKEDKWKRNGT